MATLDDTAHARLKLLEGKHLKRSITETRRGQDALVERGGQRLVSFSCNDYLGLSQHPAVVAASQKALVEYGAGAGASRLTGGNHPLYEALEGMLASLKKTKAACVFGSGYLANVGTIPALVDANDLILADKLVHACMLDGARLSGATVMRFAHNNVEHCKMLLEEQRADFQHCLILTETVFSMDGDRAPVAELVKLARKHDAWVLTDDAHGLGLIAGEGKEKPDIQMGTLSKAAGGYGGYVCASRQVIELLHSNARSLVFSTALPPTVVGAAIAALKVIREDKARCKKPLERARQFAELLNYPEPQSAIVPVVLGEPERALKASAMLEKNGYYVAAIRPPTVPPKSSRLRFAFSAVHTEAQVRQAAALLTKHGYA